jgi:hypothetical protein
MLAAQAGYGYYSGHLGKDLAVKRRADAGSETHSFELR